MNRAQKTPAGAGAFGFVHLTSFDLDLLLGLELPKMTG
jgi:hypothetical protein